SPVGANGIAVFTTSTLGVGTHVITAVYTGDATFAGSTSVAIPQTVASAGTTTVIASSANPSALGQSVTFPATVTPTAPSLGTPTGTVLFRDGSAVLGSSSVNINGQATFSTAALANGSHPITAVFTGNANFTGSTSAVLFQTVNPPLPAGTTTVVSS